MRALDLCCAVLLTLWTATAAATPLYTVREGRTCDNCHSLPNDWVNPDAIPDRKCTLSCSGCHVDPGGGGLRTVSGVYFGRSTLPMWRAVDRPWADKKAYGEYIEPAHIALDAPSTQPADAASTQPADAASTQPADAASTPPSDTPSTRPTGGLAFGRPLDGGGAKMAFLDGRYGDLNADPLLRLGADVRLGAWNQGLLVFPMQGDVYAAVHPVEHLTLNTTVGLRGRIRGPLREDPDGQPRFGVRDVWLMTHEWPLNSYARVGRFLPQFGWRLDDHTAYTRRPFGLSQEDPANRVLGAEVGFNGNYPFANATVWSTGTRSAENPFEATEGRGGSVNAGWRDLGWQVGASGRVQRRPSDLGGDTNDASLQWGFNPWFYWPSLPLAYLGEVAMGTLQRPLSGHTTAQHAVYQQLSWLAVPGLTLHGRHEAYDPDHEVALDQVQRVSVGLEWVPMPHLTVRLDARAAATPVGQGGTDAFLQLHGWF